MVAGIILLLLSFLYYFLYQFIIKVYLVRKYFSKYKNVHVTEKLIPFIGDIKSMIDNVSSNRSSHYHQVEFASQVKKGVDFRLFSFGNDSFVMPISGRAVEAFANQVPENIDRLSLGNKFTGKLFLNSLLMNPSSKNWKNRRAALVKYMGLSRTSQYIPMMIDSANYFIKEWKDGEKQFLIKEFNKITFRIITIILFGKDVNEKIEKNRYITEAGKVINLNFAEYFIALCRDLMQHSFTFKSLAFPILLEKELSEPYKTDRKNLENFHSKLKEYLEKSQDGDSVYTKLVTIEGIDKEEAYEDLLCFLFAGHETSAHAVSSALYFLAKFPQTLSKLKSELKEFRGKPDEELKNLITKEKIAELDYLYMVFKETLRIDPPVNESLPYICIKNFEMLGVKFRKGQKMSNTILE